MGIMERSGVLRHSLKNTEDYDAKQITDDYKGT